MKRLSWKRWFVAVVLLAAGGCAQKLTYQRYQMINMGDSPDLVKTTLGEPLTKTDMAWVYNDFDRDITAQIYFQDNKVAGKRWDDPEHGSEGSSPNVKQPGEAEDQNFQQIK